jgi:hypothetical protein
MPLAALGMAPHKMAWVQGGVVPAWGPAGSSGECLPAGVRALPALMLLETKRGSWLNLLLPPLVPGRPSMPPCGGPAGEGLSAG